MLSNLSTFQPYLKKNSIREYFFDLLKNIEIYDKFSIFFKKSKNILLLIFLNIAEMLINCLTFLMNNQLLITICSAILKKSLLVWMFKNVWHFFYQIEEFYFNYILKCLNFYCLKNIQKRTWKFGYLKKNCNQEVIIH